MSITIDLDKTVRYDVLDEQITASLQYNVAVNEQSASSKQDLEFYTTKNGSAWFQQKYKDLKKCIALKTIEEAISYAESNLCTIICVKAKIVKWSGGPHKAKLWQLQQL